MAEVSELFVISEEIDRLKEKNSLSHCDVNRLMLIAGRLTGILRVCCSDSKIQTFVDRADAVLMSGKDVTQTLFYMIPIAIEFLDRQYAGNNKSVRKRYRTHKKKHSSQKSPIGKASEESLQHEDSGESDPDEGSSTGGCEGGVCVRPPKVEQTETSHQSESSQLAASYEQAHQ